MAKLDLLNGSVPKTLTRLSLPMAYGIVAVLSINIADTYFVGQLGSIPLAAISFTFPVVFSLVSLSIGLGAGTASLVSRSYGASDIDQVKRIARSSLLLALVIVVILSTAGYFTIEPLFLLLGASSEVLPYIIEFMEIWYIGMPFLVVPIVANSLIRAGGDSLTTGLIMIFGALLNIFLDPLLIHGYMELPAMGVAGAAWATVFARASTLILSLIVIFFKEKLVSLSAFCWKALVQDWGDILKIGIPAALGNMANPVVATVVIAMTASFGDEIVAGFGVATRMEALLAIPLLALSASTGPFVGQNWGAKKWDRVVSCLAHTTLFSLTWSVFVFLMSFFFSTEVSELFSSNADVVEFSSNYMIWVCLSLFGYGVLIINAAAYNAVGYATTSLVLYIIRGLLLVIPCVYLASNYFGSSGIYKGIFLANLLAFVVLIVFQKFYFENKILKEQGHVS